MTPQKTHYTLRDLHEALAMTRPGLIYARRAGYIPEPDVPPSFPRSARMYSASLFAATVCKYRSTWIPVDLILGLPNQRCHAWWWRWRLGELSRASWSRLCQVHDLHPARRLHGDDYHLYEAEDVKKVVSAPKAVLRITTQNSRQWIIPKKRYTHKETSP